MQKNNVPSWLERLEDLIHALEGSTIGEIELTERDVEIIIRRSPALLVTAHNAVFRPPNDLTDARHAKKTDTSVPIIAPLTGVYYNAASPTTPPFVSVGDSIHVGQVVALIEAMKVFNEITAEVAGRIIAVPHINGAIVQKGDVLLRIEKL